jgi:hypothetical protein
MRIKALLTASLLANAVLLVGAAYLSNQDTEDLTSLRPLIVCIPQPEPGVVATPTANTAPATKVSKTMTYARIESEDYKHYIAQLRRMGYPEDSILSIISADVNAMFHWRSAGQVSSATVVHP